MGSSKSSHQPARFVGLSPFEGEGKIFLTCNVFTLFKCHVTWYVWGGPLILSHHPAKFGVIRPFECEDITFFICHVVTWLKCCMTLCCGWGFLILSHYPVNSGTEIKRFFIFVRDNVIEMSRVFVGVVFILSHHLTTFWGHGPSESGDITFFICQVTTWLKSPVNFWVGFPHPKLPPC